MEKVLKIAPKDNVVVAIENINAGEEFSFDGVTVCALEEIPAGHKMSVENIEKGHDVIKYGAPIGSAKTDIKAGSHVHIHNISTKLNETAEYTYAPFDEASEPAEKEGTGDSFFGFLREDGRAGVRNEIWIIPTVGCVNSVAEKICELAKPFVKGSVDRISVFTHPYGCSQMGDDQESTRQVLANLCTHPNAGGVLLLGLGCENSNIDVLMPYIGDYDKKRLRFLVAQTCEDEVEEGLSIVKELIETASSDKRTKLPVSKLIVGLKCGGSDGFSGITANPLVGRFSDILIGNGGTTILTEVPEMFGAETLLMNRCEDETLFNKTVDLINNFKHYFSSNGQVVYENPSPGNKAGGISTLEDKSLGCTQKSGTSRVKGVLEYAMKVETSGLNLLSAPGNDLVAATALAVSGAQIVLFTTGRGTPFASPVPTVKISSNSGLASKKKNWIDFDAGRVLLEDKGKITKEFYDYVLSVANGEKVLAEKSGYSGIAIFKRGVTL